MAKLSCDFRYLLIVAAVAFIYIQVNSPPSFNLTLEKEKKNILTYLIIMILKSFQTLTSHSLVCSLPVTYFKCVYVCSFNVLLIQVLFGFSAMHITMMCWLIDFPYGYGQIIY